MCKIEIVVPFPTKKISSLEECHSYPKVVLALAILLALLAIFFSLRILQSQYLTRQTAVTP